MFISRAIKNDFNTLICKAFKGSDKSKQFVIDVARNLNNPIRDLMGLQTIEQPQMQITQYLIDKFGTLKHIQEPQAAAITLILKFFNALDVQIAGKIKNQLQEIIKKILEPTPQNENVPNVWHQNLKTYDCICGMVHKEGEETKEEVCYKCGKICHVSCFWEKEATDTLFQCPVCFLLNCMPEKKVKNVIFLGYLKYNEKQRANHSLKFFIDMKADPHQNIQIRCCRLSKKSKYQVRFPQHCNIYLSNYKLTEFRPLPLNSPLKRRNDQQIPINKFRLSYLNTLTIEERHTNYTDDYRVLPADHHLLLIANIEPISKVKLEKHYLQRKLQLEQSKNILNHYLGKSSNDLIVDRLTLSMKCQYYQTNILFPARSKHCTTHYQPFDMINFITASLNSKTSVQRWRCPICKKRAYDLLMDQYLYSLLKERNNVADITFSLVDQPIIRQSEPSQDGEEGNNTQRKEKHSSHMQSNNNIEIDIDSFQKQQSKDNKVAPKETINPVIIDIIDSDDEIDQRKRITQIHNHDSLISIQPRKINKQLQNQSQSTQTIHKSKGNESSKEIIIQKLKEKLAQINRSPSKTTLPNKQKISKISNHSQQKEPMPLPKGFQLVNPTIQILQERQGILKKPNQQDLVKKQQQLLNEANYLLLKNSTCISIKDQIIFNNLCSSILDFKISS